MDRPEIVPFPLSRIEFCGGIGAGKTSWATAAARYCGLPLVTERFEQVPYWSRFYRDPIAYAFEKDLSFLLLHAAQLRDAALPKAVCDFALFQTVSYSTIFGDARDTAAVNTVFHRLSAKLGHPDLVVHLGCATDVQLERIRIRGRAPEAGIDADYLIRLDQGITAVLSELPPEIPVLRIDTTDFDSATVSGVPILRDALDDWLDKTGT